MTKLAINVYSCILMQQKSNSLQHFLYCPLFLSYKLKYALHPFFHSFFLSYSVTDSVALRNSWRHKKLQIPVCKMFAPHGNLSTMREYIPLYLSVKCLLPTETCPQCENTPAKGPPLSIDFNTIKSGTWKKSIHIIKFQGFINSAQWTKVQ